MSTVEAILFRARSDLEFANLLFTRTEQALADYNLTPEETAQLKSISRVDFEMLAAEELNSVAGVQRGQENRRVVA
jgi:hypothetical protein